MVSYTTKISETLSRRKSEKAVWWRRGNDRIQYNPRWCLFMDFLSIIFVIFVIFIIYKVIKRIHIRGVMIPLGTILIIGGIIGYMYTQPKINELESTIGSIARYSGALPGLQREYQMLKEINIGSVIAIVVGGIAVLVEIVGSRSSK